MENLDSLSVKITVIIIVEGFVLSFSKNNMDRTVIEFIKHIENNIHICIWSS